MADDVTGSEGFQGKRRLPFRDKLIENIGQDDIKVRFSGLVIEKTDNVLMVDDGTGQIRVISERTDDFGTDSNVRVFGRVIPVEGGVEISGEIIQDVSGINHDVYKRMLEFEKKLGV